MIYAARTFAPYLLSYGSLKLKRVIDLRGFKYGNFHFKSYKNFFCFLTVVARRKEWQICRFGKWLFFIYFSTCLIHFANCLIVKCCTAFYIKKQENMSKMKFKINPLVVYYLHTYRTCTIITSGLYIFYLLFEDHSFVFKEFFSDFFPLMYSYP